MSINKFFDLNFSLLLLAPPSTSNSMIEQYFNPETISSIIAIIVAIGLGCKWLIVKSKFSEFRKIVVAVDDAVKDNNVSKQEFKGIWDAAKKAFTA